MLVGNVLTPQGWVNGAMYFNDRIAKINGVTINPDHNDDDYILPGFIDLHVHGGGGKDVMDAGDAVYVIAATHARHGTTSMLATTMTSPPSDLEHALKAIGHACWERKPGTARVLGAHLEGPYINPEKLGAKPDYVQESTVDEVERLIALSVLSNAGMRVQIGHTLGTYEDGVQALQHGASGFTHLFNAMSAFHHREPGMAGAALAHAQYSELIPDLIHVHPGAIKTALRAIPNLYCVTDSTAATGMPDREYMLGRQVVHKCMGGVRLADGTLAGSTLTMDQALRNLVSLGLEIADASRRVSTYAADHLGLHDRGRLIQGSFADMVVLDRQLNLKAVYVEGEQIDLTNSIEYSIEHNNEYNN
ncbi:MAG: N-acetylglucosamine-6-phosphate deacetylase [Glaciimonas sp.]|nr:N-acetylglucosamine-6-phosphate deacetylase [Glaciimonas sp.]